MTAPADLASTAIGIALLAAVATIVLVAFRVPRSGAPVVAILRGTVQLAVISVILSGIIENPVWIGVALFAMFVVATSVATGRAGWSLRNAMTMASAIAVGVLVATASCSRPARSRSVRATRWRSERS